MKSVPDPAQGPPDQGREVAFAGRSNAGKSSALNVITEQPGLARTSKTPGRTRLINFFEVIDGRRLVDLPGYGYAKVSKEMKAEWDKGLARYLEVRDCLQGLFLLMDIRHPLKDFDVQMLTWCHQADLPVHVLLTKGDKLKRGAAASQLLQVKRQLKTLCPGATAQVFSALKHAGIDEARAVLDQWLTGGGA